LIPRYCLTILLLLVSVCVYLQIGVDITPEKQWRLVLGLEPTLFSDIEFTYARLPRLVMAILVGLVMGLVGSLIQQITKNSILSPMTLGVSSGAWLALVIVNIWLPNLVADYSAGFAMLGAIFAMGLVILISGVRNLSGLPVVLAGMAVSILFGALTSAVILTHNQYAHYLFIWGAGDLDQNGWTWVQWLLPKLLPLLIFVIAPRVLSLMRLGHDAAAARGLNVTAYILIFFVSGLWLESVVITAVGIIGFIGLLTPNIARRLGARTSGDELIYSALLAAILLITTDGISIFLSQFFSDLIPTGITTALLGAPALIWFIQRQFKAQDQLFFRLPASAFQLNTKIWSLMFFLLLISLVVSISVYRNELGWQLHWPNAFSWSLRWPRVLTALFAGGGMAAAGVVLQRLIHNPLASPDLLGMSAGAVLALVLTTTFFGTYLNHFGPIVAFVGSLLTLGALLLLGRRHQFAPSTVILTGIALAALIETLVQFALIKGTEDTYAILRWLSGSTYRVEPIEAITLMVSVSIIFSLIVLSSRWITLISVGRGVALARGLNVNRSFVLLLMASALLCALVTALMGPIAFVGLIAPHMASLMGARSAQQQLLLGSLLGGVLMLCSDWLGQQVIYPNQIAAGTVVALLGGTYFILLLLRGRMR
jgi:ABC-type Fe3+-siderophore transport system permease subunit